MRIQLLHCIKVKVNLEQNRDLNLQNYFSFKILKAIKFKKNSYLHFPNIGAFIRISLNVPKITEEKQIS